MLKSQAKVQKTGSETDSKSAQKRRKIDPKTWSNQSVFIKKDDFYRKIDKVLLCAFVTRLCRDFAKVFFYKKPHKFRPVQLQRPVLGSKKTIYGDRKVV
jgi:hypothetical protein